MRQAQIQAAVYASYALGIRSSSWKLHEKVRGSHNALKDGMLSHIEMVQGMFEKAEDLAMNKPEGAEQYIYDKFGALYASHIRGSETLPTKAQAAEYAKEAVYTGFESILTHQQKESVQSALVHIVTEYGEEED